MRSRNIKGLLAAIFVVCMVSGQGYADTFNREAYTNWTTEIKRSGDVTITATYRNPGSAWDPVFQVFYVQLDSKTTDLDSFNFEKDIVLRDDNDWTYLPRIVEVRGSGHHREAVLSFLKSRVRVDYLELVVRKSAVTNEMVFFWWSMITM